MKLNKVLLATIVATIAIVFGSAVFASADTETETTLNELVTTVSEDIVVDDAEVYNVNVSSSGDVTLTEVNELVTEAPAPVETPVVPTPVVEKPQIDEPVDDVETHLPPAPITETPVNELVIPEEEEQVPPTPEVEKPQVDEPVDPAPTPEEPKNPQPETPVVSETPAPKVEQPKLEVETPTPTPTTPAPVAPVVTTTPRRRLPMTGTSSSVSILLALLGVALLAAMSATPKLKEMV